MFYMLERQTENWLNMRKAGALLQKIYILTSSALLVFNSSQFYPQIPTFRFHILTTLVGLS
jgi:hypothetical protein